MINAEQPISQKQQDLTVSRRRFLGLAGAGAILLVDRSTPKISEKTPKEIADYEPVTDRQATIQRMNDIINGERPATSRELFESIADTFASTSQDSLNPNLVSDQRMNLTDNIWMYTGYFRGSPHEDIRETAYISVCDDKNSYLDWEGERLQDGSIRFHSYDENIDVGKFINPTELDVVSTASLMRDGLNNFNPEV